MKSSTERSVRPAIVEQILDQLRAQGIDPEALTGDEQQGRPTVRMVAVCADLRDSLSELGQAARDKVLMVRVDQELLNQLDAWIESGAARSRSEAAALFLREGLKVRAPELAELSDAVAQVEAARRNLREKAKRFLGSAAETGETSETVR